MYADVHRACHQHVLFMIEYYQNENETKEYFFYQLYDKLRDINYVIIAIIATRLL